MWVSLPVRPGAQPFLLCKNWIKYLKKQVKVNVLCSECLPNRAQRHHFCSFHLAIWADGTAENAQISQRAHMRSWRMGGCTKPFMKNGTRGTSQDATCCFCCDTTKGCSKWTKNKDPHMRIRRTDLPVDSRKILNPSSIFLECPKVNCVLRRWWRDEGQTDRL